MVSLQILFSFISTLTNYFLLVIFRIIFKLKNKKRRNSLKRCDLNIIKRHCTDLPSNTRNQRWLLCILGQMLSDWSNKYALQNLFGQFLNKLWILFNVFRKMLKYSPTFLIFAFKHSPTHDISGIPSVLLNGSPHDLEIRLVHW